jgi:hypothetical protein
MALFYFGKSRFFLPRVLGSFIIVLAIVMFVVAAGHMFDSWDAMKKYPKCIANIDWDDESVAMLQYSDCKDSLYRISGLQLRSDQPGITTRQFLVTLLMPVAELLFWSAAFVFGLFLYNTRIVHMAKPAPEKEEKEKRKKR